MRFSVIIATLGRPDVLSRTLDSVARCEPAPDELIVVDGDAESRSSEPPTKRSAPFPIRYMTADRGLPKQRNAGIDAAKGDVVVFVDDDVELPTETFSILARVYEDAAVAGATAHIVEPAAKRIGKKHSPVRRLLPGGGPEGTFTRFGYPRRLVDLETERDISFMHGSFMSVRRKIAARVRFDEVLPGYALAEDEDFSFRVSREGRIRFVPSLKVLHAKEGHGSRDARSFGRTVVINRSYLFQKNFKRTLPARLQFAMLIALFVVHRAVNREFAEVLGLLEGSIRSLKNPLVSASKNQSRDHPRVAFVSSHSRAGGSERYLMDLLEGLDRSWITSIVCLEDGPLVAELRERGHDVHLLATTGSPLLIARAGLRLKKALGHPTVVHANGVKAALACSVARLGAPVVWVKHDFSFDGPLVRAIASRCDRVVGVSAACLAALSAKQRERATVVHTGMEIPEQDRPAARRKLVAELGLEETSRLVGMVGRLHPVKGHLDLIEAGEKLVASLEDIHIVFIGGEDPALPDHARLVRRSADRLGANAHFLGHREPVIELMAGLDVGVMASNRDGEGTVEALPLTLLEMMGAGTPTVSYASGGIPEAVGDCGMLVPPGDADALAVTIASVVSDPFELERMSTCGRGRVSEHFSRDEMNASMAGIYEELSGS